MVGPADRFYVFRLPNAAFSSCSMAISTAFGSVRDRLSVNRTSQSKLLDRGLCEFFAANDAESLTRLEPLGKWRKEFAKQRSAGRAERVGVSESTWPQAG